MQSFNKVDHCLKIMRNFFNPKVFLYKCQKIQIRQNKTGTNFDLTTDFSELKNIKLFQ